MRAVVLNRVTRKFTAQEVGALVTGEYMVHGLLPDAAVDQRELEAQVDKVLRTLTDRERQVLTARFGLDGDEPRTYEDVGQDYGVTKERIRQIEQKGLRKLRHRSRSWHLKSFVDPGAEPTWEFKCCVCGEVLRFVMATTFFGAGIEAESEGWVTAWDGWKQWNWYCPKHKSRAHPDLVRKRAGGGS